LLIIFVLYFDEIIEININECQDKLGSQESKKSSKETGTSGTLSGPVANDNGFLNRMRDWVGMMVDHGSGMVSG